MSMVEMTQADNKIYSDHFAGLGKNIENGCFQMGGRLLLGLFSYTSAPTCLELHFTA